MKPLRTTTTSRRYLAIGLSAVAAVGIGVGVAAGSEHAAQRTSPHAVVPTATVRFIYRNTYGKSATAVARHEVDFVNRIGRITTLRPHLTPAPVTVFTPTHQYLRVPAARRTLTGGRPWASVAHGLTWGPSLLVLTPTQLDAPLYRMIRVGGGMTLPPRTRIGTATIRGLVTTHYRQLSPTDNHTADVWVAKNGHLVRRRDTWGDGSNGSVVQVEQIDVMNRNIALGLHRPAPAQVYAARPDQLEAIFGPGFFTE